MKLIITEDQFKKLVNLTESTSNGITVFHGTNHKISKFVDDFIAGEKAIDANGPGIYFSDNEHDSSHFGSIMYTVKLNSTNFITDKNKKSLSRVKAVKLIKMNDDWEMYAQDRDENPNIGLGIFLNEIFNSNDNSKDILLEIWGDYYRYKSKDFVRNCVKLGIDGINATNVWGDGGSSEHYIVYNPQIIEIINIKEN